jgi:hypothetical protein
VGPLVLKGILDGNTVVRFVVMFRLRQENSQTRDEMMDIGEDVEPMISEAELAEVCPLRGLGYPAHGLALKSVGLSCYV